MTNHAHAVPCCYVVTIGVSHNWNVAFLMFDAWHVPKGSKPNEYGRFNTLSRFADVFKALPGLGLGKSSARLRLSISNYPSPIYLQGNFWRIAKPHFDFFVIGL